MKINFNTLAWVLLIAGIFALESYNDNKATKRMQSHQDSLIIKKEDNEPSRGYDFKSKKFIPYQTLTDDAVRQMRKDNPDKIIRVHGRYIPSDKELFEERVEEYVEENRDEIYESLKD